MDEKIYLLVEELKATLDGDERIIHLNKIEKEMNENEEVILLSYKKDLAASSYSDLLKIYNEENEQVIIARKKLLEAKNNLDNHPVVREYLKSFQEVRTLLYEVNNILFDDFKGAKGCR